MDKKTIYESIEVDIDDVKVANVITLLITTLAQLPEESRETAYLSVDESS